MPIARHSPNTRKAIFEVATTLTNGHGTYIHANFTVLTAMLLKIHVYGM
jgi:hypothetical protein